MKTIQFLSGVLIVTTFMFLYNFTTHSPAERNSDLDTLAVWLTGSFSSQDQALTDSAFRDVRLHMVVIWPEKTDGYWFYVEQALAEHQDKPYRQRIYHLYQTNDTTFLSDVYTIRDPLRFAGSRRSDDTRLSSLTPDLLTLREGCTMYIRRTSTETFQGGTLSTGCSSEIRGASYATSQVTVQKNQLMSWDRGFDSTGQQVWGAETGGYQFKKINPD